MIGHGSGILRARVDSVKHFHTSIPMSRRVAETLRSTGATGMGICARGVKYDLEITSALAALLTEFAPAIMKRCFSTTDENMSELR